VKRAVFTFTGFVYFVLAVVYIVRYAVLQETKNILVDILYVFAAVALLFYTCVFFIYARLLHDAFAAAGRSTIPTSPQQVKRQGIIFTIRLVTIVCFLCLLVRTALILAMALNRSVYDSSNVNLIYYSITDALPLGIILYILRGSTGKTRSGFSSSYRSGSTPSTRDVSNSRHTGSNVESSHIINHDVPNYANYQVLDDDSSIEYDD